MTQAITQTDTLVVGAGQAGVAMSEHLSKHGVPHLVPPFSTPERPRTATPMCGVWTLATRPHEGYLSAR